MTNLLLSISLLFAFVNSVMFSGILLFPILPRFISVLVVFIALPIFLVFVYKYLWKVLIAIFKFDIRHEDELVGPLAMSAVTLSIPLAMALFAEFAGGNYLHLRLRPAIDWVSLEEAPNYSRAGFVELTEGRVEPRLSGITRRSTSSTNGNTRTRTIHSYYVYPVIPEDWNPTQPIHAWLCESVSNPESTPYKMRTRPEIPELEIQEIKGIPIHDAYSTNSFRKAIANSTKNHNILSHPQALLLAFRDLPYSHVVNQQGQRFSIFLSVVNLLWVGGFGFVMVKAEAEEKDSGRKQNNQHVRQVNKEEEFTKHRTWSGPQNALARTFTFTPEDLAANRRGTISKNQEKRMGDKQSSNVRMAWTGFALFFGIGLLGFSAEIIRNDEMGIDALLWYFLVVILVGSIVLAVIYYHRWRLKRTLSHGKAEQVNGRIFLTKERGEKTYNYYFQVSDKRFDIDKIKQFDCLIRAGVAGRDATLYISSPWESILSIELDEE